MALAFFRRDGEHFVPGDAARGPWNREVLHGRVISGLLAYAIEHEHGDADFQVARLTVDMFRAAPFAPVEVATRRARDGNRIRVIDATMSANGVELARASAVLLRRAEDPPGAVWSTPTWQVPPPDQLPPQSEEEMSRQFDGAWETRTIDAPPAAGGAKRAWLRQTRVFIDGEEPSALVRVATAADFANPFANGSDVGLNFVNADVTLYLHRPPRGEWLGFEVASHQHANGVAVGECALYDVEGPIGRATASALAQIQRPR